MARPGAPATGWWFAAPLLLMALMEGYHVVMLAPGHHDAYALARLVRVLSLLGPFAGCVLFWFLRVDGQRARAIGWPVALAAVLYAAALPHHELNAIYRPAHIGLQALLLWTAWSAARTPSADRLGRWLRQWCVVLVGVGFAWATLLTATGGNLGGTLELYDPRVEPPSFAWAVAGVWGMLLMPMLAGTGTLTLAAVNRIAPA